MPPLQRPGRSERTRAKGGGEPWEPPQSPGAVSSGSQPRLRQAAGASGGLVGLSPFPVLELPVSRLLLCWSLNLPLPTLSSFHWENRGAAPGGSGAVPPAGRSPLPAALRCLQHHLSCLPRAFGAAASRAGKLLEGEAPRAAWATTAIALAAQPVPSRRVPRVIHAEVWILCIGRIRPQLPSTAFFPSFFFFFLFF